MRSRAQRNQGAVNDVRMPFPQPAERATENSPGPGPASAQRAGTQPWVGDDLMIGGRVHMYPTNRRAIEAATERVWHRMVDGARRCAAVCFGLGNVPV